MIQFYLCETLGCVCVCVFTLSLENKAENGEMICQAKEKSKETRENHETSGKVISRRGYSRLKALK